MNLKLLQQLVQKGESEFLELKKSTASLRQAGETLCAFLNSGNEGRVLIGVTPSGQIIGQDVTDRTLQDIAQLLKHFEPHPNIEISRLTLKTRKQVIQLRTPASSNQRPFVFQGRAFQRIGTTTSILSQEHYKQLMMRNNLELPWERISNDRANIDDLDQNQIRWVLQQGIHLKRLPDVAAGDLLDALEKLDLAKNGYLNHSAMVLFGKGLGDYPQCHLRVARFKGIAKDEFLDHKQYFGSNAFTLLEEAEQFLARHIPVAGKIIPYQWKRVDTPLIPFEALREAIVNAICHRDYTINGGAIDIAIYDDRVEIWSTGSLPSEIRAEDLTKLHRSVKRNPVIARVLYCAGLVEQWGRGTQKIVSLCTEVDLDKPRFVANHLNVGVIFPAPIKPSDFEDKLTQNLSARQREIVRLVRANQQMALREIKRHFANVAERTLQDDLLLLKREQLIESKGRGRAAHWFPKNNAE